MATNITFLAGTVDSAERINLLGQIAITIWLTGLSASGKVPTYSYTFKLFTDDTDIILYLFYHPVNDCLCIRTAPPPPKEIQLPIGRR